MEQNLKNKKILIAFDLDHTIVDGCAVLKPIKTTLSIEK
jgi:hypothetical protein